VISRPAQRVVAFVAFAVLVLLAASMSIDRESVARMLHLRPSASSVEAHFDHSWASDPSWDDGLCEVSTYDALRVENGAPRSYEVTIRIAKKKIDSRLLVETESSDRRGIIPVLELSAVELSAGRGTDSRSLTSAVVRCDDPLQLVKVTSGVQDWGGNTFKELVVHRDRAELTYFSYLEGVGDGRREFAWRDGDLISEQLPLALRGLRFKQGLSLNVRILPEIAGRDAPRARPVPARIVVDGREAIAAAGGLTDTWRVSVERNGGWTDILWFDAAPPGGLVRWYRADGLELNLVSCERRPPGLPGPLAEQAKGETEASPSAKPIPAPAP
jgi:hypothetical protein